MASKRKNNRRKNCASGSTDRVDEPTREQIEKLDALEQEVDAMAAQHGAAETGGSLEAALPTLEKSIDRVVDLLKRTRAYLEGAKADAEVAAQQRAELDDEKAALALRSEAAAEREAELDAEAAKRSRELDRRSAAVDARDADLAALGLELGAKHEEASRGFHKLKADVLRAAKEELAAVQAEREQVRDAIAAEQREAAAAAEEERQALRTELQQEAEALRQAVAADLESERATRRAAVESELAALRAAHDEHHEAEKSRLEEWREELAATDSAHAERARALRSGERALRAERELLDEDREELAERVKREVVRTTEGLRHELASAHERLQAAQDDRDAHFDALRAQEELARQFGKKSPTQILSELKSLSKEKAELEKQLRERPDTSAVNRLAELERERSAWLEARAVLQAESGELRAKLATHRIAATELETVRKEKELLEVHRQVLDGAVAELRAEVDSLTESDDRRDPMRALTELDNSEILSAPVRTGNVIAGRVKSLADFATDLKHRVATAIEDRELYYADRDIRSFIGGLAMSRLMLLQGISGTGKTSLPLAFAKAVASASSDTPELAPIEVVEVQAGWRDRQDLLGYYNAFHRHYYATNFLQALYRAGTPAFRDRPFLIVLDEINLSRPEQFFADFLSVLEKPQSDQRITLLTDPAGSPPKLMVGGRHLPIPPNVWFVGTANQDESTIGFADKTYDRAHVMEMPRKTAAARFEIERSHHRRSPIGVESLKAAFDDAARRHEKTTRRALDWLESSQAIRSLDDRFGIGWGNRLENQAARFIPVVVECGGDVGEAMDHLLCTKLLRKLRDRHDVRTMPLEKFRDQLFDEWSELTEGSTPDRSHALLEAEIAGKQMEDEG